MIIRGSLFQKEFRNTYMENGVSFRKMLNFSVFLGLVTFAVYFVLHTLTNSVLIQAVPQLMIASYFPTLYLYVIIAYIFYVFYFIIYYDYLTFAEITKNRWYCLVKMSYNINSMIFVKIFVKIISVIFVYSLGFLFTVFLTYFLKFPFIVNYMLALYFVGAINLIVIVLVTLVSSLFIKDQKYARYTILIMSVLTILFQILSGYSKLITDNKLMGNIIILFDFSKSLYLVFAASIIFLSILISLLYGNTIAKYYTLPVYRDKTVLENLDIRGITVLVQEEDESGRFKYKKTNIYNKKQRNKTVDIFVSTFTILVICALIIANGIVLAVTFVSPEKEIDLFGTIPYVFESETMEPIIMFNDLALFSKITATSPLRENEIILFKDKGQVGVAKILSIQGDIYNVDINNYSDNSRKGTLHQNINRREIYGIYYGRSRWLGALILFANNASGRIILLFVPAFLVFFHKPIMNFFKNLREINFRQINKNK